MVAATDWSSGQAETLKYICGVSNVLSALGCGFIVYCFLVIRQERRNYFQRLVFYLSIVDLFNAVQWVVALLVMDESDYVCRILGPYKKYLYLASFFWTTFIATEMLYRFTHIKFSHFGDVLIPQHSNIKERYYHLIAWVVPLPFVIWPLVDGSMSNGSYSCWYSDPQEVWSFVFLGLVVLTVLYCTITYAFVTQRYFKMLKLSGIYSTEQGRAFKLETKVPAYILSFIICWGPALATNVVEAIDTSPTTPRFYLECMTAFLLPLTGWLNSIVYGWSRELHEQLFAHLRSLCCSCCVRTTVRAEERRHLRAKQEEVARPEDSVQLADE